jgi:hypothetical protein
MPALQTCVCRFKVVYTARVAVHNRRSIASVTNPSYRHPTTTTNFADLCAPIRTQAHSHLTLQNLCKWKACERKWTFWYECTSRFAEDQLMALFRRYVRLKSVQVLPEVESGEVLPALCLFACVSRNSRSCIFLSVNPPTFFAIWNFDRAVSCFLEAQYL